MQNWPKGAATRFADHVADQEAAAHFSELDGIPHLFECIISPVIFGCKHKFQNGCTPLHKAVGNHDVTMVKLLLFWGDPGLADIPDNKGYTALHLAARAGYSEIVQWLVDPSKIKSMKNKANPNLKTQDGNTALHLALFEGHVEVARVLKKHGADLDITNANNLTAADRATNKARTTKLASFRELAEEFKPARGLLTIPQIREAMLQSRPNLADLPKKV